MTNEINKLACRVCGKIQDDPPWGEDGQCPTYDICDCCGIEFGYGDCTLKAIQASRERWLAKDAKWKYPEEKPTSWSLEEQMKNIPEEYK
jgi:hypothetical protein